MENGTVEKDDRQCCPEGEIAKRQVRALGFDGHGNKIDTTGAGILHIDQSVTDAAYDAAADGRQQTVAGIHRHDRQQIVGEQSKEDHAAQAAQQKGTAQQFVAEKDNGHIDDDIAQAHGKAEQAVKNGTDTGDAGDRHFGSHGKAVDACSRDEASQHLQQQVDGLILGHGFPP